jgi:proteic killer suppression protein
MIQSFKDADTHQLFEARSNKRWGAMKDAALRRLDQIEASIKQIDLRVPLDLRVSKGNRLEALKGVRTGQHSIRINNQYRILYGPSRRETAYHGDQQTSFRMESSEGEHSPWRDAE